MLTPTTDSFISTRLLSATPEPQKLIWLSMHQCYSSNPTEAPTSATEAFLGEKVVEHLLAGNRGHYSPLEQAHLSLSLCYLPHSLLQQLTRHRHLSFSVQSFRYTSKQFVDYAEANPGVSYSDLSKLLYLGRSPRTSDIERAHDSVHNYRHLVVDRQMLPEEARGHLLADYRQHAVVGGNLRAWWHVLDLRLKPDTQPEFQQLALQVQNLLRLYVPQLQQWYDSKRATKAVLSP